MEVVREITWVNDPQATWYLTPCKGCTGYCVVDEGTEDERECHGESHIRKITTWVAFVKCDGKTLGPPGMAQDPDEADDAAVANYVAELLTSSEHG